MQAGATSPPAGLPAHSPMGPSALQRVINCPGSYSLSQQAMDGRLVSAGVGKPSYYAAAGTVAHSLAEAALSSPNYDLWGHEGSVVEVEGHSIPVNQDLLAIVETYVQWAQGQILMADWSEVEVRVDLMPYWGDDPDALDYPPVSIFGTADLLAYHRKQQLLVVGDLKSGAGVSVSAYENPQLFAYAAGALHAMPGPVRRVRMAIVQPASGDTEDKYVKEFEVTALDVEMWVGETLKPAIAKALSPGAAVNPGPWCQFCAAKAICPALYSRARASAKMDFGGDTPVDPVSLDPAQMAEVLNEAHLVAIWQDAVKAEAKARLEADPDAIPGWRARARTIREWNPYTEEITMAQVMRVIANGQGVDNTKIWDTKLKSPAQFEKLIGKKNLAGYGPMIGPYIYQKPAGVVLIPTGSPASTGASEGES